VAVKVIDLKMLKNDINRELLYSEIEILKELRDSPHVLRLCDIFSTRNNTYIITELCSGDLSSAIKQGLPPAQALLHMHQILQGYLQFHGKRVVHRDLKPANILLTHCGLIKIADFGFAIKAEALGKGSKYNVGSPLYMAPESLKKNDYSYKSDIWALGVIFYEMLFADTPWRAKNEKELLRKIENEPIETVLAAKTLSLPPNARDFLTRCLRVDKHARMGPEELHAFSFTPTVAPHNVLGEKTLNIAHRVTGNDSIALGSPLQEKKSLRM
jgi:serine/threonine protein kinase